MKGKYLRPESIWTEVLVRRLTALWRSGKSAREIAVEMGVPKGAVVGKAHRLGLPAKTRVLHEKGIAAAGVMMPTQGCLWPLERPGEPRFRFCGAPVVEGKPYCLEHAERAYRRAPQAGRGSEPQRAAK